MLYPFTFGPICMERVCGGRRLEKLFGKELPPEVPIGETWEISDRPGAISDPGDARGAAEAARERDKHRPVKILRSTFLD